MNKTKKQIISGLSIVGIIACCYSGYYSKYLFRPNVNHNSYKETVSTIAPKDNLMVHYLDVGQGDSIFIELPNEETMLIDAGESKSKQNILNYIENLGYEDIDYVVATHPHADHIGSMNTILKEFEINHIFLPNKIHDTKMFNTMLNTIKEKDIPLHFVQTGYKILEKENLIIEVLNPIQNTYSNLNNYSIIIKMDYGESEFLFTGDAEILVEEDLLKNNIDIDSDILKVGHHGSNTSSGQSFIESVSPNIAIISCGINNKYNHPNIETIETLTEQNVEIYRTDILGTIIIEADMEENFIISTKKEK